MSSEGFVVSRLERWDSETFVPRLVSSRSCPSPGTIYRRPSQSRAEGDNWATATCSDDSHLIVSLISDLVREMSAECLPSGFSFIKSSPVPLNKRISFGFNILKDDLSIGRFSLFASR